MRTGDWEWELGEWECLHPVRQMTLQNIKLRQFTLSNSNVQQIPLMNFNCTNLHSTTLNPYLQIC